MNRDGADKLLKRLDILISLQIMSRTWETSTDQDRIRFLNRFGLRPTEIAEIMNKTGDQISKQLYAIKTKR